MQMQIFGSGERYVLRWVVFPLSLLTLGYCVWAWHPIVGFFSLLSVVASAVFGFDFQRANTLTDTRLPHERWPEILDWRIGDKFDNLGFNAKWSYGYLNSIGEDGYASLCFCDDKWWVRIGSLVGHNQSLLNRRIDSEIKGSHEYMDLLDEFHKSVDELKARDRRNGIAA